VGLCAGTVGVAQTQLTVTFGISRSRFGSGTTVAVTGFGFSPNATVNVWYDQSLNGTFPGKASISPPTDSNGAFSTSLVVKGDPGPSFIHAGISTTPVSSLQVNIETCWFQECMVNDVSTVCILGSSPGALQFAGVDF